MNRWTLVIRSLLHYLRMNVAVAMGVAAATAVLTGALIVGDSVRVSLRHLALDRLGTVDEVLVSDRFFRTALSEELAASKEFDKYYGQAVPAILFPRGTVQRKTGDDVVRATGVFIVGAEPSFWELGTKASRPAVLPGRDEIVLNAELAEELRAEVGDEVLLRLPKSNEVPADSPLGEKSDRIRTIAGLRVVAIIPNESLGRFSLTTSQITPRNAYVATETLQDALDQEGKVNSLLVAGQRQDAGTVSEAHEALSAALLPNADDFGVRVSRVRKTFRGPEDNSDTVIYDYYHITSNRMLFESAAESAVRKALSDKQLQPVSTYVANSITEANDPKSIDIPYSLITGIDSNEALGPLRDVDDALIGPLEDDEVVLNSWAAADLDAKVGQSIRITFYKPETTHGQLEETSVDLKLRAIVPLTEPVSPYTRRSGPVFEQPPTQANDPDLTPEVEGVTDQASIADWEAPFPVDYDRVRGQDDDYWENHRTTPKAFVSLTTAEQLWGSRFGRVTSFRLPAPPNLVPDSPQELAHIQELEQRISTELSAAKSQLGFAFIPIRARSVAAAAGTTPFDVLFLALSFFVIAAAVILLSLLFRLAVEQRTPEIGTLLALGFSRRQTTRILIAEGVMVAANGALIGVAIGTGYAWLMITGLRNWWVGAITTPFLQLHITSTALIAGYVSGIVVSAITIWVSLRFMRRVAVRNLLSGNASDELSIQYASRGWQWSVAAVLFVLSLTLAFVAATSGGQTQAGEFVGAGATMLAALLIAIRAYLKAGGLVRTEKGVRYHLPGTGPSGASHKWYLTPFSEPTLSLVSLAARNAARNPGRSTMTIGLMAVASFLIMAMGAFRAEPTIKGTGGFDLMAESDRAIFENLNEVKGKERLLGDRASALEGSFVAPLRIQPGDDASCTNLYRPSQPQVLGVSEAMREHFESPAVASFGWAATAAGTPEEEHNPWRLLPNETDDGTIPVILDMNTAMYSLQLYRGLGEEFEVSYGDADPLRFRVVGLLGTCILQGSLLIDEAVFLKKFPEAAGYRMFLIQTPAGQEVPVADALEDRLSDQGLDVTSTTRRLEGLLAVQNAYLSTFQTLGALGLLLGTFGLATVQVRNVFERRRELALMRAAGFRRGRLAWLVLLENLGLLLVGLLTGFAAAMFAVLPSIYLGGASIPLRDLSVMLAIVLAAGIVSSLASVRSTLHAPLLSALRGS